MFVLASERPQYESLTHTHSLGPGGPLQPQFPSFLAVTGSLLNARPYSGCSDDEPPSAVLHGAHMPAGEVDSKTHVKYNGR